MYSVIRVGLQLFKFIPYRFVRFASFPHVLISNIIQQLPKVYFC